MLEPELLSQFPLVEELLIAYEGEGAAPPGESLDAPYVPFERAVDAAVDARTDGSARQAVGDLAFLAQLELRQRKARLERVAACRSAVAIIGECDSALRRIRKVLTAIDVAFARAGIAPQSLDYASELRISLCVRRACAKLRASIVAPGEPTPAALRARLRRAGTAIAVLVGWDVYPHLRVRDRLALRELQRRILDWLREGAEPTSGIRLWQDLAAFLRMLAQINRRQELVDHDARLVRAARDELVGAAVVHEELLARLSSLEGLDEGIDALLRPPPCTDAAAWDEALAALSSPRCPPASAAPARRRPPQTPSRTITKENTECRLIPP